MKNNISISIIEPEQTEKREQAARKRVDVGSKALNIRDKTNVEEMEQHIKDVRENARSNINSLVEQLKTTFSEVYPDIKIKSAADDRDAVNYIDSIANGLETISINNSSIVTQEIRPGLIQKQFHVINSYLNEFDMKDREIQDYWDLPHLLEKELWGNFNIAVKMEGIPETTPKNYIAVLGINSISADNGTIYFVEHFSNIDKDLKQASKIVLIVGLDKIVSNANEAAFQAQCMGVFGMESVVLSIEPNKISEQSIDEITSPLKNKEREIHIILLDNGRSKLLEGKFKDLFLCIGCRACNKHCPIRHSFADTGFIWTPRNYLNQFLYGKSRSVDICLHCEACRLECPLDIDLPALMWQAKADYVSSHGRSFYHKILGIPELLAKFGTTFAPLSNLIMKIRPVRIVMELVTGIDRKTVLPTFHFNTFRKWFKQNA